MKTFWPSLGCAITAGIAASAAAVALVSGPSYDCTRAQGQVQELICTNESLAALDRTLADVYAIALDRFPLDELSTLKAEQRGWIKGRDECWKADDVSACVTDEYHRRTVALQIKSGQLMAPTPVSYKCDEAAELPFSAAFYGDTHPASVVLTYGPDQVIAFSTPSGSGAKYATSGVEFWEHHGEATVDWFGKKWKCKVIR
jgi:uncharacterized protein